MDSANSAVGDTKPENGPLGTWLIDAHPTPCFNYPSNPTDTISSPEILPIYLQKTQTMAHSHSHDGGVGHSHDDPFNGHGHSHDILDGPGSYINREMPLIEGRDWKDRAFTIGIGG